MGIHVNIASHVIFWQDFISKKSIHVDIVCHLSRKTVGHKGVVPVNMEARASPHNHSILVTNLQETS